MTPLVVFPDVTALVLDVVRVELAARSVADVEVVGRVPSDRTIDSGRLVLARTTGGETYDVVFHAAQLTVEAWDDDEAGAHDLAQLVLAIVRSLATRVVNGVAVYRVDVSAGPTLNPDPESVQPRYTASVTIVVRGYTTP